MEKLFLVEIDSLDQGADGCFASNAHFAEMFQLSKNRCSEVINSLKDKKIIKITYRKQGKQIKTRVLKMVKKVAAYPIRDTEYPYSENLNTPIRKTEAPYSENTEGNNTSINNTKERETRALDFLLKNYPSRTESVMMQIKSQIKNFEKFSQDFNDTVDQEELNFSDRVLFARLGKYARNWIENQAKQTLKDEGPKPAYLRKIS